MNENPMDNKAQEPDVILEPPEAASENLEPLEEMVQTEEDLYQARQEVMTVVSWNGKRLSIGQVNWLLLLQALAFLWIAKFWPVPTALKTVINEVVVVGLPGVLLVLLTKRLPQKVYRLRPLSKKTVTLIIGMMLSIYPLTVLVNALVLMVLGQFMDLAAPPPILGTGVSGYLETIALVCLLPAIFEEMAFRGILLHAHEEEGKTYAVWMTAILFAVFHFSLQNFVGPLILGIILGYLVLKTGSLYAAILGHFVHNFISNTIIYLMNVFQVVGGATNLPSIEDLQRGDLAVAFTVIGLLVFFGLMIFVRCVVLLKRHLQEEKEKPQPLRTLEAQVRRNDEFLPPPKDNIFETTPIWLMGLLFVIVNWVAIVYQM